MIIKFNYYYCCITFTQDRKSPLNLAHEKQEKFDFINTQGVIKILEAHENKP